MQRQMISAQGWELDEYDQNMNQIGCYSVIGFVLDEEREEVAAVYVDDGEIGLVFPDGAQFKLGREGR